jgi:hypothetical protein
MAPLVSFPRFFRPWIHFLPFSSVSTSTEHETFVLGKRNGKLNKVIRVTATSINFDPLNSQNFIINVHGPGLKVLEALELLQDELPAEISFHIPESYHRRIIGKGGASIQDVMRRHSAFVQLNSSEAWARVGGFKRNEDNVVCITPQKNGTALPRLRQVRAQHLVYALSAYVSCRT